MAICQTIISLSPVAAVVITEVTVAAFESMEISDHTEQFIIEALR